MFIIGKELQNNPQDGAMLGAISKILKSRKMGRKESKNIPSNFSFVIGDEKCSHKYMCFDNKNFDR